MKKFVKESRSFLVLLLVVASFIAQSPAGLAAAQAGVSPDGIWRQLDREKDLKLEGTQFSALRNRPQVPENAKFVQLDASRLRRALKRATGRISAAARTNGMLEITLPLPDGTFARFAVEEAPIIEQQAGAPPDPVTSYRGQGIDDPTLTARFNVAPDGVHAIVLAPGRTSYIDPFPQRRGDTSTHINFFRRDYDATDREFNCLVGADTEARADLGGRAARPSTLVNGDTMRTYRLAVAATGEYTRFHGRGINDAAGRIERARQAILNTMVRVNGIYERELAITMRLVANERDIIFDDPDKDPYQNGDADAMLGENQTTLDDKIKSANYDIGHVFGVGSGGLAIIRSVGRNSTKAQGVTGSQKPIGDPFDVDYVAHEMGHQFGANHTFNATTGSCGSGNRNPPTAYEPGSGSTIMAYAGICKSQDLQQNSDDVFHVASLEEIINYVRSAGAGTTRSTNNHPPTVTTADAFTIPKGTPFMLSATGTDQDGDFLTYSWEEFDLGESNPPDDDTDALRPIFRAFLPLSSGARTFPRMERLLGSGAASLGEALPTRNRTMTFRVTARDNRAGGGGIGDAATTVSVITDAGPFAVIQPFGSASWQVGSTQTVTWDVAGTSAAPLNTSQVRISLSTDGGKTFNVIAPNAPNTGSASITVPNTPTTAARIKVEAVNNIYFNVSPGNFRIMN